MKSAFLSLIFSLICLFTVAQPKEYNLIPYPASIIPQKGTFYISNQTKISAPEKKEYEGIVGLIGAQLAGILNSQPNANNTNALKNSIYLVLSKTYDFNIGDEGYSLQIKENQISIQANAPAGWFNGWQTLIQLIKLNGKHIPALTITDKPKFAWRGLMLDVSRHFFSKEIILKYIDQMAKYKFNVLHLHLTDNQGWRIEIKQLPKLTEVGAWRVPRTGYWKDMKAPEPNEQASYGGYYTQEDIREIVAYAKKRYVDIVPEIDLPGHSLAFVSAYPEVSCTKTPQQVLAGDPWNAARTNVLCAGNDSVYTKLDQIISEIAALFPSKYIHIGGDEVTRSYWNKCPQCQQRIKTEGLNNIDELQTYFINRVANIVSSKGKTPIGWFDNLPGKISENITLMSWKDNKGGIKASNDGNKVIMTPAFFTYLDFYQGDPYLESGPFTVNRLSNTYKFNPLPEGIKTENVLGGQGSLWTEQVPNERKLQFMTWPRGFALIENLWSAHEKAAWPIFASRIEKHLPLLEADTVNYSKYFYDALISGFKNDAGDILIKLDTELPDLKIYYAFDDTDPDQFYPVYEQKPLAIPKGAKNIRVVTYRGNQQKSRIIKMPLSEIEKRIKP